MKKTFTRVSKLLLLALACSTSLVSRGQTYAPVALTGFTQDIIANGTAAQPPASSTTADVDGVGYFFISQDYYTATTAHTSGLPNSGLIPNSITGLSGLTYQLASYSANNSLRLQGGTSGTVTFATPTAASEVYVLGSSGSGASAVTMTVNYSDGTTTAFTGQAFPDWFTVSSTQNVFGMSARASATIPVSATAAANTAPFLDQVKLTIPAAKTTTPITGVTVASTTTSGVMQVMAVSIATYPACTTVPTNLTTTATTTSGGTTALTTACPSTSIYLALSGLAAQTGLTYQWQSSPNGTTWTNITGATSATYTATQTATTYYRAQVGCANAGSALTASTPVQITQNTLLNCYCTPTYSSGGTTDNITSVTLGTLTYATTGNTSPYYHDYSSLQTGTAPTLSIPNLFAGANATVTLTFGSDGNQYSAVWIDFNANGTFDASEYFTLGTSAGANGTAAISVLVPATATLGQTKMRVRGGDDNQPTSAQACGASGSNYGEAEDYLVNIVAQAACTGTPPAISAVASATTACAATSIVLSATGVASGTTGLTYQWQSKLATATTFANISGATTATYTVTNQAAATDYRLVVTCTASTQSATSNTVSVAQSPFSTCYCTVVSNGASEYIKGVTLPGAPGFTNTTGANSTNGYGDFTASTTYTTTMVRGTSNNVSVTVRSNATGSQGGLWVDYNQNGLFDASEYTLVGTSSLTGTDVVFPVSLAIPTTALAGPTRMRVRWRNSAFTSADACVSGATAWFGETEDYRVTISATPLATTSANAAAKLALFPNPTQSAATLTGATAGTTVQVLDVLGRVLLTAKADAAGKADLALPTGLAKGVYLVRAGQLTTRLVVE